MRLPPVIIAALYVAAVVFAVPGVIALGFAIEAWPGRGVAGTTAAQLTLFSTLVTLAVILLVPSMLLAAIAVIIKQLHHIRVAIEGSPRQPQPVTPPATKGVWEPPPSPARNTFRGLE